MAASIAIKCLLVGRKIRLRSAMMIMADAHNRNLNFWVVVSLSLSLYTANEQKQPQAHFDLIFSQFASFCFPHIHTHRMTVASM